MKEASGKDQSDNATPPPSSASSTSPQFLDSPEDGQIGRGGTSVDTDTTFVTASASSGALASLHNDRNDEESETIQPTAHPTASNHTSIR